MTPKNADESREAGVTDEVIKLLVREFENVPWQLKYRRRWKIALEAAWPVAAEQAHPADSGRAMDALRDLVEVCEAEFCSDGTDAEPDNSKVAHPEDECHITFGHIRRARAALAAQGQPAERVPDVLAMVNRFLGWSLPKDFAPDGGINFNPLPARHTPHCWPVGTNLFTAAQATAMVEYMLAAAPQPGEPSAEDSRNG